MTVVHMERDVPAALGIAAPEPLLFGSVSPPHTLAGPSSASADFVPSSGFC